MIYFKKLKKAVNVTEYYRNEENRSANAKEMM